MEWDAIDPFLDYHAHKSDGLETSAASLTLHRSPWWSKKDEEGQAKSPQRSNLRRALKTVLTRCRVHEWSQPSFLDFCCSGVCAVLQKMFAQTFLKTFHQRFNSSRCTREHVVR